MHWVPALLRSAPKAADGCSAMLWVLLPHFSLPCFSSVHLLPSSASRSQTKRSTRKATQQTIRMAFFLQWVLFGPVRADGPMQVCLRVLLLTIPR